MLLVQRQAMTVRLGGRLVLTETRYELGLGHDDGREASLS